MAQTQKILSSALMNPENTGEKQSGRFVKGRSGNPRGKPKGALNSSTRTVMELMHGEAGKIGQKAIELALDGDMQAIKLILERILPRCSERPVSLQLPCVKDTSGILLAEEAVMSAVTSGALTITEGQGLMAMLDSMRKSIETNQFEQRIIALEEARNGTK
ncbi:MAG: hypothetical protein JSS50_03525 [Proteobacteria bacterium]|nr:hypothetical protein [Pseudomonadota bacterium]